MGSPAERRRVGPEELPADVGPVLERVAVQFGTPTHVYFERNLRRQATKFKEISFPFGTDIYYAMKAWPNAVALRYFTGTRFNFKIDASTYEEVTRATDPEFANIPGHKIRLTGQQVLDREQHLLLAEQNVAYTAGSLEQLIHYGEALPQTRVGVRFNPGYGSGGHEYTRTGGNDSAFGISVDNHSEVRTILQEYGLTLDTVHLHIGSGAHPGLQGQAVATGLEIAQMYPEARTLDVGGGFHVARMSYDYETDVTESGRTMGRMLADFAEQPGGRELRGAMEPGTFLVADNWGVLTVGDVLYDNGRGYDIVKVDGGMTFIARNPMYDDEHPLIVMPQNGEGRELYAARYQGPCCETGDSLNKIPQITNRAKIGDRVAHGGAGAYGSSQNFAPYNTQSEATEIFVRENGKLFRCRERQPVREIYARERIPADL